MLAQVSPASGRDWSPRHATSRLLTRAVDTAICEEPEFPVAEVNVRRPGLWQLVKFALNLNCCLVALALRPRFG
jgi:hypothetical protein